MSRHRLADAEHAADIRAEMDRARTPADQLTLMRKEIARLEQLNKH
jgi:hypothetical protein